MSDTYAINVAKTEYREAFDAADASRLLSVFAEGFAVRADALRPTG
jgi:hypothetical protein